MHHSCMNNEVESESQIVYLHNQPVIHMANTVKIYRCSVANTSFMRILKVQLS